MSPRIKSIQPCSDYRLLIEFTNGKQKEYNMNSLINRDKMYEPLKNLPLFNSVVVDGGGYGVSWNDDIDMSEHELWINGVEIISKNTDLTLEEV
ncbi:MAG: DUF2442 domain-containing protein [Niameybacter sp.]|uniref:DUF2442 domain-containing protein n=1 Tax=Niameybacter sp. TaxID=2033640 RepID=UPI002FCBEB2A